MSQARLKVLFFAEAVTLAHVARPMALAARLEPKRFEVFIACDPRYKSFLSTGPWHNIEISSITSGDFGRALARGSPVYDHETLARYVRDDLAVIEHVSPDLIVGDFRLSLSVSARLAKIPYFSITNAYWSPAYSGGFPMPVLPMTRWLPIPLASALFDLARPIAMASHCKPLNTLRKENGLSDLGTDVRRVYTDADELLCADAYPLMEAAAWPARHTQLGALPWAPPVPNPDWWDDLQDDRPIVYVTLGSSGPPQLLAQVLAALEPLRLVCIASSAGGAPPKHIPKNARVAAYLDGNAASRRASLVICNGGSPTTQQALAAGVPVLGLASNMDQMLNMQSVEHKGAGEMMRADRAGVLRIRDRGTDLMQSATHRSAAERIAGSMANATDPGRVFEQVAARHVIG